MGRQDGQSHTVLVRRQSYFEAVRSLKIRVGGKAILGLSRLDYPLAKTGEAVNGGLCYLPDEELLKDVIMKSNIFVLFHFYLNLLYQKFRSPTSHHF